MASIRPADRIDALNRAAIPMTGSAHDYDSLIDLIGDARFVLLGEASHGTHEFYQARAEITRRLITEKGFTGVAVEGDWPDCWRVNRFVRGYGDDQDPDNALEDFGRFPLWMWRNTDARDFIGWLRDYNRDRPRQQQAGFYGLDLYSLYGSVEAVIRYLDDVDPEAAKGARRYYSCLDSMDEDAQYYGYGVKLGMRRSCEEEVVRQLMELQANGSAYLKGDGSLAEEELFQAQQNARVVHNAENYYRSMFTGRANSWNMRDSHMVETLEHLDHHLSRHGDPARIVIWEHNSHVGDSRATEMSERGEHNVGQLVRQRYGDQCRLIGFTTHAGTVTAADDWDGPADRKRVRPALDDSVEHLFHQFPYERFFLPLREQPAAELLGEPMLERAIGVIYRPQTERQSHYFECRLGQQFDAVFHFDHTRALVPLDMTSEWQRGEMPETYPSGM